VTRFFVPLDSGVTLSSDAQRELQSNTTAKDQAWQEKVERAKLLVQTRAQHARAWARFPGTLQIMTHA
jgi:hypothetical protein